MTSQMTVVTIVYPAKRWMTFFSILALFLVIGILKLICRRWTVRILKVAACRCQAVGPADACARSKAQKAHCIAGKAAVFDDQYRQAQKGACCGWPQVRVQLLGVVHDPLLRWLATQTLPSVG